MDDPLEHLQVAVATAARVTGPGVVAVGRGAGTVIGQDRILTNAHNLTTASVRVRFGDGRDSEAEVVAADLDGDLAVVDTPTGDAPTITWADAPPALGAAVLALGAPRSGPGRVTIGFVSGVERRFRGPRGRRLAGIEHTAPVGRGSSGGPLLDVDGRVVGINTHRPGDGFYLAVPVSPPLRSRIAALARGEAPERRHLGVAVAPSEVARRLRAAVGLDERVGVLVREVESDSPGARGGLREGDLIVSAAGLVVTRPDVLLDAIDRDDDPLPLTVVRGEQELELSITFVGPPG